LEIDGFRQFHRPFFFLRTKIFGAASEERPTLSLSCLVSFLLQIADPHLVMEDVGLALADSVA
jgi:hypothetical protein